MIPGEMFLHAPVRSHVPLAVMQAMARQPMDMGDPRLAATIAAVEGGLRRMLGTASADVFLYATNGHGAWEAVIANLVAPGTTVLVPGTGISPSPGPSGRGHGRPRDPHALDRRAADRRRAVAQALRGTATTASPPCSPCTPARPVA